jgi:hypothetical protein
MRVYRSWRFPGSALLLTTAVMLWLGAFLFSWPVSESEVYASSAMAGTPHAEQAASGYEHQIDGTYFTLFAQEDEARDRFPKNAALLRTLVFVLFFGLALGWLVVSGWRRRRPEVCSSIRCWFHSMVHLHQRRAVATLLGVFLL